MTPHCVLRLVLGVCFSALSTIAVAQSTNEALDDAPAVPTETENTETTPGDEPTPDTSADLLNSRQQLQQTFTLQRTINGEVVDSERRTVTYSRGEPFQETEANRESITETLKSQFDEQLLTRNEAFEEAKIDFIIADANRDGAINADEFALLVASWEDNNARNAEAPNEEIARQRHYDDFLSEISQDDIQLKRDVMAKEKFAFMAGASESITREDYIREYLLDFDTMDVNGDALLQSDELRRFRAVMRGEKIEE